MNQIFNVPVVLECACGVGQGVDAIPQAPSQPGQPVRTARPPLFLISLGFHQPCQGALCGGWGKEEIPYINENPEHLQLYKRKGTKITSDQHILSVRVRLALLSRG